MLEIGGIAKDKLIFLSVVRTKNIVVVSWSSTIQVYIVIGIQIFIFIFGLGVTNILCDLPGVKPNTSCIPVGWVFIYSCLAYVSTECIRKRG